MGAFRIGGSVGIGGTNRPADIRVVQQAINANLRSLTPLRPLVVDGSLGRVPATSLTVGAIMEFQRRVIRMAMPDGRVDPNGGTLRQLNKGASVARSGGAAEVTYSDKVPQGRRIASDYAKGVIKLALLRASMPRAVITSTLRTPDEQAAIMYKNAQKNLAAQFRLYGRAGDQVLRVYKENASKPRAQVVALMEQKIKELLRQGTRTSKHCIAESDYKALNVIDIGLNSTRAACGAAMNAAGFTKALADLRREGYIDKFIDETNKSNQCWHIEVRPGKKPLTAG